MAQTRSRVPLGPATGSGAPESDTIKWRVGENSLSSIKASYVGIKNGCSRTRQTLENSRLSPVAYESGLFEGLCGFYATMRQRSRGGSA